MSMDFPGGLIIEEQEGLGVKCEREERTNRHLPCLHTALVVLHNLFELPVMNILIFPF